MNVAKQPFNARRAIPLIALLFAGCSLAPVGSSGQSVSGIVGDLLVTRDVAARGAALPIDQSTAEGAALAWVALTDETVRNIEVRQSSHVVGLVEVTDQRTTLRYSAGDPEDDWVILLLGDSPEWSHANAMLAIDAVTGEVRSGQLAKSN